MRKSDYHGNCPLYNSYVDSIFYCLDGVRKCIRSVHCSGVSVAHANDLFLGVAQYRAMPNIGPPPLCKEMLLLRCRLSLT